jgi:hypothetical protein
VVLFTDQRLPDRIASSPTVSFRNLLPAGTLVHVVGLDAQIGKLERDDGGVLAPLASMTEGLAVLGRVDSNAKVDALQLVRPISLDLIEISAPGWTMDQARADRTTTCPIDPEEKLVEGSACMWWARGGAAAGPIRVDGMLWNHHVTRFVQPELARGRELARILSAIDSPFADLSEEIDLAAFAVNPAWSLFGRWGGSDCYSNGFLSGASGVSGRSCCSDPAGPIATGSARSGSLRRPADLATQLATGIKRCHPGDAHISIALELTALEIVDVGVAIQTDSSGRLRNSVTEAVWDTSLSIVNAKPHDRITVELGS